MSFYYDQRIRCAMAPAISQFLSNIVATFQNLHSSLGFLSPLETPGPGQNYDEIGNCCEVSRNSTGC